MTVREIVKKYLEENGYDGLVCDGCECSLDDLALFGLDCFECVPAKKVICKPEDCGDCSHRLEGCEGIKTKLVMWWMKR